ncbi:MAG: serine/threonine-protein kinase RIO2 [Candidatus Atabeyarchaeum deiterrae]
MTSGENAVIKLQRHGRISFRGVRRTRGYVEDRRHTSWLYISRLAAGREYLALQKLYPIGVSVPKPIACNRHAIVMSAIEGDLLADCRTFSRPLRVLNQIIENVRKAYIDADTIHSDLSEYNIIVTPKLRVLIIDWPQWVDSKHPNWQLYLERDMRNILYFFDRKFGIKKNLSDILTHITHSSRSNSLSKKK